MFSASTGTDREGLPSVMAGSRGLPVLELCELLSPVERGASSLGVEVILSAITCSRRYLRWLRILPWPRPRPAALWLEKISMRCLTAPRPSSSPMWIKADGWTVRWGAETNAARTRLSRAFPNSE
jgi:hypothetical protein